jgi:hypothetical protein
MRMDLRAPSLKVEERPAQNLVVQIRPETRRPEHVLIDTIRADLAGGLLTGEGELILNELTTDYRVSLKLVNALVDGLSMLEPHEATGGHASGSLILQGQAANYDSITGSGRLHVQGAKLLQLPKAHMLLQLLHGRLPKAGDFNEARIEIDIANKTYHFDRLEMLSSNVRLELWDQGENVMDMMDYGLDLTLVTRARRGFRINPIDELGRIIRNALLRFRITGTLYEPEYSAVVLGVKTGKSP